MSRAPQSHCLGLQSRRWLKFSLVGGVGIGVQLAALAALTAMGMNYLLATALAVEGAVLHNFFWHQRFTWVDRTNLAASGAMKRLLRFHLGNGSISLLGNLIMMRLFAGFLHLPVVGANFLAVIICWLANFFVSDRWVFSRVRNPVKRQSTTARASAPAFVARKEHK
ncbi:MAG: GtrA family protein [Candidatus Sulfotelmatobacter sp.]